ncbi:MAG: DUF6600 domain-containing protein [Caldimonas sp.]
MKTSNEHALAQATTRSWWGRLDAVLVLAAFLGLGVLPAKAQTAGEGDPPSRVARLSEVDGQVWIYNDETDEWVTANRNRPLTTGDRLAADNGARAEITLGSTTLRIDAGTEIEVALLDDSRYVVHLTKGSVAVRLRSAQALAEFEVDTDEGSFRAQTVGRYRIDRSDQGSDLTVYSGQAAYEQKNTALPLYTGQHAQFWIDAAGVAQYAMVAPARDAFSAWNDDRDRGEDRVATTRDRFVSPEMTGSADLARYGQWQQTPDDGPIWIPTSVPSGWAPYSAGHWAWVRPWGWTWVDDAPWGFAPFHYGRWVYRRDTWGWAPGTYVARPVYAPALVAWIGGPRVGVSISVGGPPVGWFPLAPREVYVPSYRASPRYVREVNITHVTNVTRITTIVNNRNGEADRRDFANRRFPNAVTFVPSDVMTRRQPVGPAAARYRNDPQLRAFVGGARPAPTLTAPPVAAPVAPARPALGGHPPRPPFEGRGPGGFAGRPDGARPDPGRVPGGRPVGVGPVTAPPPVGAPATVVGPVALPRPVGPVTSPPPVGAPQGVAPRNDPAGRVGPPFGARPGRGGRDGADPAIGVPTPREPTAPPAVVAPAPVRAAPTPGEAPQRMRIPAPVQRGTQPSEGARVAPALRGRGGEGGNGETRVSPPPTTQAAPHAVAPPPPGAAPASPESATGRRPERMAPPRQVERARAAEVAPPVPAAVQAQPAAPQPAAPRAVERRPADGARPATNEPGANRPEAPRPRDERRDDKGERR